MSSQERTRLQNVISLELLATVASQWHTLLHRLMRDRPHHRMKNCDGHHLPSSYRRTRDGPSPIRGIVQAEPRVASSRSSGLVVGGGQIAPHDLERLGR